MAMLSNRGLIIAKKEVTYGVDPTPVAGDAIPIIPDSLTITVDGEVIDVNTLRESISQENVVIGSKTMQISFDCYLKGSGTAAVAARIGRLIKACGFGETIAADVQYDLASTSIDSVTIYAYLGEVLYKFLGCRGNAELNFTNGQPAVIKFTMTALYTAPADSGILGSATFETTNPLPCQNMTFTYGGVALQIQSLNINLNNEIVKVEDLTSVHGIAEIVIAKRSVQGGMNPILYTVATRDSWANWNAGTGATLDLVLSGGAGNIIEIDSGTNGCKKRTITPGNRDNQRIYDTEGYTDNDGFWEQFSEDSRVRLRVLTPQETRVLSEKHTVVKPNGKTVFDQNKFSDEYLLTSILAWEGFKDSSGAEIECNDQNKMLLLKNFAPFFKFVDDKIHPDSAYSRMLGEEEKN
jgi:hypothetical protein